ncbi:hypothetical protein PX699_11295 [Sphingobium sp. H39-3-25]|uniref:hypothetical protein n=1 Tax=Sphingobium arseniciresistens TaxID=3030834 RepID=UPI0023B92B51|nr:hypothetical protein [Sphingobium arseniciresistens]
MLDTVCRPSLFDESLFREADLVDGAWGQGQDGAADAVANPANGHVMGGVPSLSRTEIACVMAVSAGEKMVWVRRD